MARSNKEAQANRSKAGADFQREVYSELETFLETKGLDSKFEVKNLGRTESVLSSGKLISPDVVILEKETKNIRVRFGCKTSLRERWKQDDRDSILCSLCDRIPWIEITRRPYQNTLLEGIRTNCLEIQKSSSFVLVVSFLDPDRMYDMFSFLNTLLVETR